MISFCLFVFENLPFRIWQYLSRGSAAGLSPQLSFPILQHIFHWKTTPYFCFAFAKLQLFLVPNTGFVNFKTGASCPYSSTGASSWTHLCSFLRLFSLVMHQIQFPLCHFCSSWACFGIDSTCLWSQGIHLGCRTTPVFLLELVTVSLALFPTWNKAFKGFLGVVELIWGTP